MTPEQLDAHRFIVLDEAANYLDQCLACGNLHPPTGISAIHCRRYRPRNRAAATAIRQYAHATHRLVPA